MNTSLAMAPRYDLPLRVTVITALLVAGAVGVGVLGMVNSTGPELADEPLAPLGLTAVVAGPAVLALLARRRPALLLAAGCMCVPVSYASIVTLPLLPLGILLATGTRVRQGGRAVFGTILLALAGPALAVAIFATAYGHEDPRCWTEGDGTVAFARDGNRTTITSSGSSGTSTECTSDVVTTGEALAAVVVLALGAGLLARVASGLSPPPDEGSPAPEAAAVSAPG